MITIKTIDMNLELLKPELTDEEGIKLNEYNQAYELMVHVVECILSMNKYRPKNLRKHYEDGKYWGYFASHDAGRVLLAIKRLKVHSVMDLGCGAGLLLAFLRRYGSLNVAGIELDEEMYRIACELWVHPTRKNLFDLTEDDIRSYELLYMWDPIYDAKLSTKFIKHLLSIIGEDQVICCYPGGFNAIIKGEGKTEHAMFNQFTFHKLKQ